MLVIWIVILRFLLSRPVAGDLRRNNHFPSLGQNAKLFFRPNRKREKNQRKVTNIKTSSKFMQPLFSPSRSLVLFSSSPTRPLTQLAAGPAFGSFTLLLFRTSPSLVSSRGFASRKKKMAPKKPVKREKVLLGRPGNSLKSGIVCANPSYGLFCRSQFRFSCSDSPVSGG